MNYKMIAYVLAWVVRLEGIFLFLPVLIGLVYCEYSAALIFLIFACAAVLIGFLGTLRKPKNVELYTKDGFVAAGLSWIVLSLYGAIPFVVTGDIPSYLDALFEIVSGFTTTGASILTDVEVLTHAALFWRSFSHWIGGMGVLVFLLMVLPVKSGSQMNLMVAESPGPDVSKFVPRVRNTARFLYKVYIGLTIAEMAVLLISGMNWFDTLCISFGTAGTGGFGVLNASCGAYTVAQQWIITVFMIAFGINFSFYYLFSAKRFKDALKMEEVRLYFLIVIAAVVIITINVFSIYGTVGESVRQSFFQVGSIMTTTGFSTTDFDLWPQLSKTILLALMFCGACAGSTGGGIKVSRILLCTKAMTKQLRELVHPRSVTKIRMDGRVIEDRTILAVYRYMVTYFLIFAGSLLIISIDNFSMATNFSAVAATLNNIGPGFEMVGPTANYAAFSPLSKIILCFDMLAGRLELFPLLILFYRGTWRRR